MTRKDYAIIAAALKDARPSQYVGLPEGGGYTEEYWGWSNCVTAIARALHADNARFDYDTFYVACKYKFK